MKDVVDYELKIRASVENSQNKQESMEIEEPVENTYNLLKRRSSRNKYSKMNSIS